jgi:hypothetical protein
VICSGSAYGEVHGVVGASPDPSSEHLKVAPDTGTPAFVALNPIDEISPAA